MKQSIGKAIQEGDKGSYEDSSRNNVSEITTASSFQGQVGPSKADPIVETAKHEIGKHPSSSNDTEQNENASSTYPQQATSATTFHDTVMFSKIDQICST